MPNNFTLFVLYFGLSLACGFWAETKELSCHIKAVAAAVDITYLSSISLMKGEAPSSPLQAVIT